MGLNNQALLDPRTCRTPWIGFGREWITKGEMVKNFTQWCEDNGFKDVPAVRFCEFPSKRLWDIYRDTIDGVGALTPLGRLRPEVIRILRRHGYDPLSNVVALHLSKEAQAGPQFTLELVSTKPTVP